MKVRIHYSDGQYLMYPSEVDPIELDDRDWTRFQAFQHVASGWDKFIRDLDERKTLGPRQNIKIRKLSNGFCALSNQED